jgi:hypothetical protein
MLYFRMVRDVRIEDEFGSPSDLVNLELRISCHLP